MLELNQRKSGAVYLWLSGPQGTIIYRRFEYFDRPMAEREAAGLAAFGRMEEVSPNA